MLFLQVARDKSVATVDVELVGSDDQIAKAKQMIEEATAGSSGKYRFRINSFSSALKDVAF